MTSTAVEPTTIGKLLAEIRDAYGRQPTLDAYVDMLLEHHPDVFEMITPEQRRSMLREYVRDCLRQLQRNALSGHHTTRVNGATVQPVIRMGMRSDAGWDVQWRVGAVLKTTRELTRADLRTLIQDRHERREELRAQILWFTACLDLIRKQKVSTLGGLEERGVALPDLEVAIEDLAA